MVSILFFFFGFFLSRCNSTDTSLYSFRQNVDFGNNKTISHQTEILLSKYSFFNGSFYHAHLKDGSVNVFASVDKFGYISSLKSDKDTYIKQWRVLNMLKGFFSILNFNIHGKYSQEIDWQGKCDTTYSTSSDPLSSVITLVKEKSMCKPLLEHTGNYMKSFDQPLTLKWSHKSVTVYNIDRVTQIVLNATSSIRGKITTSLNELNDHMRTLETHDELIRIKRVDLKEYFPKMTSSLNHTMDKEEDVIGLFYSNPSALVEFHLAPYFPTEEGSNTCSILQQDASLFNLNRDSKKIDLKNLIEAFKESLSEANFAKIKGSIGSMRLIKLLRCVPYSQVALRELKTAMELDSIGPTEFVDGWRINYFDVLVNCGTELCLQGLADHLNKIVAEFLSKDDVKLEKYLTKQVWPAMGHIKLAKDAFFRKIITLCTRLRSKKLTHFYSCLLGITSMAKNSREVQKESRDFVFNQISNIVLSNDFELSTIASLVQLSGALILGENSLAEDLYSKYFTRDAPESLQIMAVEVISKLALNQTQKWEYRTKFLNLLMDEKYQKKTSLLVAIVNELIIANLHVSYLNQKMNHVFSRSNGEVFVIFMSLLERQCQRTGIVDEETCMTFINTGNEPHRHFYYQVFMGRVPIYNFQVGNPLQNEAVDIEYELMSTSRSSLFYMGKLNFINEFGDTKLASVKVLNTSSARSPDKFWLNVPMTFLGVPLLPLSIPLETMDVFNYLTTQGEKETRFRFSRLVADARQYIFLSTAYPIRVDASGLIAGDLKSVFTYSYFTNDAEYTVEFNASFIGEISISPLDESAANLTLEIEGVAGNGGIDFSARTSLLGAGEKICLNLSHKNFTITEFSDDSVLGSHSTNFVPSMKRKREIKMKNGAIDLGLENRKICEYFA